MTCIKTGANVMIQGHGVVHGDLFEVGNCYILSCGSPWRECIFYGKWGYPEGVNLEMSGWYECGMRTLVAEKQDCTKFNYEGVKK